MAFQPHTPRFLMLSMPCSISGGCRVHSSALSRRLTRRGPPPASAASGNRVYTGADDNEAYFAIPGPQFGVVEESLAVIVRANEELEKFHRGRAAASPTA